MVFCLPLNEMKRAPRSFPERRGSKDHESRGQAVKDGRKGGAPSLHKRCEAGVLASAEDWGGPLQAACHVLDGLGDASPYDLIAPKASIAGNAGSTRGREGGYSRVLA